MTKLKTGRPLKKKTADEKNGCQSTRKKEDNLYFNHSNL